MEIFLGIVLGISILVGFGSTLVVLLDLPVPQSFKKWSCKKGLHSFKLEVGYDEQNEYLTAFCAWCGKDCVSQFGQPPRKFTDLREKILKVK